MKFSKILIFDLLLINFTASFVGCIDSKSRNSTNGEYATLTTPYLKPASSTQLKELANSIKLGVRARPCGTAALRRSLFKGVIDNSGVPYTQLATLLCELTDPDSKDCDGNSCSRPFGIKTYEVHKFLKDSKRAADLIGHNKLGHAILQASLTEPPEGGEWKKPDKKVEKIIYGKGSLTVYTYQKQSDFEQIVGKKVNCDNRSEANALAEALLFKKMVYGRKSNQIYDGNQLGVGLYAATDPTLTPGFGEVLVAFQIPWNVGYSMPLAIYRPWPWHRSQSFIGVRVMNSFFSHRSCPSPVGAQ